MMRRVALLFILALTLTGWSCTTGTVETSSLKAKSAALDTILLANESAKLAAGVFDTNCPRQQLFTLEQCVGWRHFAEGHAPKDPICLSPTFLSAVDVMNKCGFKKAFPLVIRAYSDGKDSLDSIVGTVKLLLGGTKTFVTTANQAQGR